MTEPATKVPLWRRLLASFLASIVGLLILLGLPVATIIQSLTSQATVQQLLADRSLYETARERLIEIPIELGSESGKDRADGPSEPIKPQDIEAYRQALNKYFSYETYQQITGSITEGIFTWLDSDAEDLDFEIKLVKDSATLKRLFTDIMIVRFQSLPVCSQPVSDLGNYDPFGEGCRDRRLTESQLRQTIDQALKDSALGEALTKGTISSEQIAKDMDQEALSRIRSLYQIGRLLPWIILTIMTLFSALIYLTVWHRRPALRKLGLTWLIPASVWVVVATGWLFFDNRLLSRLLVENDQSVQLQLAIKLADRFSTKLGLRLLLVSAVLGLLGVAALVGRHFISRAKPDTPQLPKEPGVAAKTKS